MFAVHLLGHLPRLARTLRVDYGTRLVGLRRPAGTRSRRLALAIALAAGCVLALVLASDFAAGSVTTAHGVTFDGVRIQAADPSVAATAPGASRSSPWPASAMTSIRPAGSPATSRRPSST